jgi:hypothetical protein
VDPPACSAQHQTTSYHLDWWLRIRQTDRPSPTTAKASAPSVRAQAGTDSLGTPWGLFRHYWVIVKLFLTVLGTAALLLHAGLIRDMANEVAQTTLSATDLRELRMQLVADAAAALVLLITTTVLAIYKPRGLTPYGLRRRDRLSA